MIGIKENKMYQELVARVAIKRREDPRTDIQPPATEESLARLRQRARDEMGAELPEGYLDFLRLTDGLNWEGLFIYASDRNPVVGKPTVFMHSFVEDNLDWRSYEPHKNYLIFADGDISLFVYNLVLGRYEHQDRSSGTVLRTYDTFDALITEALKSCLHEDEEDEEDENEEDE